MRSHPSQNLSSNTRSRILHSSASVNGDRSLFMVCRGSCCWRCKSYLRKSLRTG
ncbi:hypothetical protein CKA32_005495 [Geitlerinema sp. FC II]|nr:hypothetical protein CKA32_005495 [Geitlerinema sp. FC II]